MTTLPVIPSSPTLIPSATVISPDDPRLNTPCEDYSLTTLDEDGEVILRQRYREHLSRNVAEQVLWLVKLQLDAVATAVANCCRQGEVFKACRKAHYAKGYRKRCHDPFCVHCGKGVYRLGTWLYKRSLEAIASQPQVGIELRLPRLANESLRAGRDRMASLTSILIKRLKVSSSVVHDVIDPNAKEVTLRLACVGLAMRYPQVANIWKSVAGPDAWCNLHALELGQPAHKLLLWVFSAMEPALMLSGKTRAELRTVINGCRLIRTTGSHYSPLSASEIESRKQSHLAHSENEQCPVCRGFMPTIPKADRRTEPTEDIESRYSAVEWTSEIQLFPARPVVNKTPISDIFFQLHRFGPSPPRYGPN